MSAKFFHGFIVGSIISVIICLIVFYHTSLLTSSSPKIQQQQAEEETTTTTTTTVSANTSSYIFGVTGPSTSILKSIAARPAMSRDKIVNHISRQPRPVPIVNQSSSLSSSSSSESARMSRSQCKFKYGGRGYFPVTSRRLPPMLYTFPGSGNTWCRLLIEHSTGIYTGSVYNDQSLLEALPGEFTCNWQVSAIKVHPHTHEFADLRLGTFGSDNGKCNKGGVRKFERAILLIRDPFDSIWSEFQRRVTQSHVSGVPRQGFDWHRWQANAAALSHQYFQMWEVQHAGILKHFANRDVLFVRYERLKNPQQRVEELAKVYQFLMHPSSSSSSSSSSLSTDLRGRLECAFILAESKQAHRSVSGGKGEFMTKDLAYTQPLICRMWALFGFYAVQYGYKPYGGIECNGKNHSRVPKINVGPQGEYNHKWVKPGQKLIDFGGYDPSAFKSSKQQSQGQQGQQGQQGHRNPKNKKRRIKPNPNAAMGMSLSDATRTTVSGEGSGGAVGEKQAAWKKR